MPERRIAATQSHHFGKTLLRILRLLPFLGTLRRARATLFDAEYYLGSNPDVALSGQNPFLHFLLSGGFEGRKPHPLFDAAYYMRQYPDVADAEVNPLVHYVKYGAAQGRRPHPLFPDNPAPNIRSTAQSPDSILYSWWLQREKRQAPPPLAASPGFDLLLEISQARLEWLKEAVASVRAQSYGSWELWICGNASADGPLGEYLDLAARSDARIHVIRLPDPLDPGIALNQAAALGTGDYLVTMGPADRLAPDALHWLATKAPAEIIYSDEDHLDEAGERVDPLFKPEWSSDLLFSDMFLGQIMAISRIIWQICGGFRSGFGQMRDYDLALRATECSGGAQHLPRVLYHSRRRREAGDLKRQCVSEAVRRRGIAGEVEEGIRPGSFRLRRRSKQTARVSAIICSRSPQLLDQCLTGVETCTGYSNREIVVVQHLGADDAALQEVIRKHAAKRVPYSGVFDFSRMNNLGVEAAEGEILVFLNDDTEPLEATWLDRLVAQVEQADAGIAGARLLYPSGTLQHGGVAIGIASGCGHIGRNMRHAPAHWPWLEMTRDVSAVTGACLAMRADLFRGLGGFDEVFPVNYNDIDLCLRVREAGYRVIFEAGATLRHSECQTRRRGVITSEENDLWHNRWGKILDAGDRCYSPNLTRDHEDLSLGYPGGEAE